ncbi:restriction endonuclease subunit S [Segatella copri]|uniref:restriction endonuclease subunit S n=1 Tax=Segatella copri TaxID=165179 RepID=UPI003F893850
MEWKEVRLGDVCTRVCSGGTPKSTNLSYYGGKIPWLNTKEIDFNRIYSTEKTITDSGLNNSSTKWIAPNTVTVAMYGATAGKSCIVKVPMTTNQACCNLTINDEVADYEFVYYTLKNDYTTLASLANGGAQQNLNAQIIKDYVLKMPSLADQRRIASILSSLDRKIELNNKINADLEEMAQAIFKNWLSECSDDVTIGELSLNITNYEKTDAEEVVLINSSDVTEGYFDHHNYSPNKNLKGHFKKRFQKGDILYSQVRPRNRHWAYCNFDANDYLASTQLMVIRNNPSLITSILLYQYIISDNVWKEFTLKTETRSGTFPQGNYEDLSQIRVPYNSDVEGISNQLETLYAKMFMLEKENSRLSLLRDTLLPRLMSGELEVPE